MSFKYSKPLQFPKFSEIFTKKCEYVVKMYKRKLLLLLQQQQQSFPVEELKMNWALGKAVRSNDGEGWIRLAVVVR